MNVALQGMLDRYQPQTLADHENALKEVVQELALLGLWRARFFEHAAFYGGTALRIFHRLPRFSEDIDFSLLQPDREFDLAPYLEAVRKELAAFDFDQAKRDVRPFIRDAAELQLWDNAFFQSLVGRVEASPA